MKYSNCLEISADFIKDGWNEDTSFEELTLAEAKAKGYTFAINGIRNEKKYFKMVANGNIYDSNGKLLIFGQL